MAYISNNWKDGDIITSPKLNNIEQGIQNNEQQTHKFDFKMIADTIGTNWTIPADEFSKINDMGASVELVVMCPISSTNDPNPQMQDRAFIENQIATAQSLGASISMLKPHLGTQDDFARGNYAPSDYSTFFTNWTNQMLVYADICNSNGIPILCIGCEQTQNTDQSHLQQWVSLIQTVKSQYPNILITYAMQPNEFFEFDNNDKLCQYLDLIGLNIYPRFTTDQYTPDMEFYDLIPGWTHDVYSGGNYQLVIDRLSREYNKKVLITEIGCSPYLKCINMPYNDSGFAKNHSAQALWIEAIEWILSRCPSVVGLAWWHNNDPFGYYEKNETAPNAAETALKNLMENN